MREIEQERIEGDWTGRETGGGGAKGEAFGAVLSELFGGTEAGLVQVELSGVRILFE
jgi:hypothetical protein